MDKLKLSVALMYVGIFLAISGGILFLVVGGTKMSGVVGWGCGAATTIFSAGMTAIKLLRKTIAELDPGTETS
mgnify:CR=1 FL=1